MVWDNETTMHRVAGFAFDAPDRPGTRCALRLATLLFVAGGLTHCSASPSDMPGAPIAIDSGSDTHPSDGADPDESVDDAKNESDAKPLITEEEWQRVTAPVDGPHEIEQFPTWPDPLGCPTPTFAQDYRIKPFVDCPGRFNPDFPTVQFRDCDVQPYCRRHADCSSLPFGRCRGYDEAFCVYPSAPPSTCTTVTAADSSAECAALPGGWCSPPQEPKAVHCYPTGRCEMQQMSCSYPQERCAADGDCTTVPGGSCQKLIIFAHCVALDCLVDDDCGTGRRCACSGSVNRCVPADCATDADCPTGEQCLLERGCRGGARSYHCTTPLDTCRAAADCPLRYCDFEGHWQCSTERCVIDSQSD